jgi:hypothetical protein
MEQIATELRRNGFAVRPGVWLQSWMGSIQPIWHDFATSWNDLGEDDHMKDGGRYRRRRYAVFEIKGGVIARAAHQPHYQAKIYNRLNGGLERWFEPVTSVIADHPITRSLIFRLANVFETAQWRPRPSAWHVELHQFRIEADPHSQGLPTPEGVHRDGVDGAFVMLVCRDNVASGVTEIFDPDHKPLGHFTLTNPGDAVFLDDARVFHGVTPITPLDLSRSAVRDVLVITFTAAV